MQKLGIWILGIVAAFAVHAPVVHADTIVLTDAYGRVVNSQVTVAGTSYNADWYIPNAAAPALMLIEHGFSRGCGNLRNVSVNIMHQGLMVLCLNADMSGGNPALGQALGSLLASRALTPPSAALPAKYIVGGHSAGGHFGSEVGRKLVELGYANFAGALMFDPVAAGNFSSNLSAISANGTRPVLAITANGSLCNSFNNSYGALRALANPYVGSQLTSFSTHNDSEGGNTDIVAILGCGSPASTNIGYVQALSAVWARDLAFGTYTASHYPGGSYLNGLISKRRAKNIK